MNADDHKDVSKTWYELAEIYMEMGEYEQRGDALRNAAWHKGESENPRGPIKAVAGI